MVPFNEEVIEEELTSFRQTLKDKNLRLDLVTPVPAVMPEGLPESQPESIIFEEQNKIEMPEELGDQQDSAIEVLPDKIPKL